MFPHSDHLKMRVTRILPKTRREKIYDDDVVLACDLRVCVCVFVSESLTFFQIYFHHLSTIIVSSLCLLFLTALFTTQ